MYTGSIRDFGVHVVVDMFGGSSTEDIVSRTQKIR